MFVRQGPNTFDAELAIATLFAAAASTASSLALDLGQAVNVTPHFELQVDVPALPTLVAGESVTFQFQHSSDGTTFTNLPISFTIPGVASTGAPATSMRIGLASTTLEYVRLQATNASGGPDLTALSFTFQPVFWTV